MDNTTNATIKKIWSISFSYRLGLGFHALNNEGSDGSNLMQPRRIDVGKITYDGISGEIIRHHILENFAKICERDSIPVLPLSSALHPDRGPLGIRAAAKLNNETSLSSMNLHKSVRKAIEECAIIDVGGFLAAYQQRSPQVYIAERNYIENSCVSLDTTSFPEPVKRESCFDVAWLISQEPQDYTVTQHSTFRDTASLNDRYAQTMRSNIYGGVIRADLFRIGTDDHWYLQSNSPRIAIKDIEQSKRQLALIEAIINFIAAPTGAKVAAWAPHVFLTDGAIVLSSVRTAPFVSPIKVAVSEPNEPVQFNDKYKTEMGSFNNDKDTWCWNFNDAKNLLDSFNQIKLKLNGKKSEEAG